MQAVRATQTSPSAVVVFEQLDRARLNALAYAGAVSDDVSVVHVDTGRLETLRIRERWRHGDGGARLDVVAEGPPRERILAYLQRRAAAPDPLVVIVPTIVPRVRWLYPLVNWNALSLTRAISRMGIAVTTAPYRV
jgi:hypothetical protein